MVRTLVWYQSRSQNDGVQQRDSDKTVTGPIKHFDAVILSSTDIEKQIDHTYIDIDKP